MKGMSTKSAQIWLFRFKRRKKKKFPKIFL
jgi:hypothetical protein